jgi:hypothetical protein
MNLLEESDAIEINRDVVEDVVVINGIVEVSGDDGLDVVVVTGLVDEDDDDNLGVVVDGEIVVKDRVVVDVEVIGLVVDVDVVAEEEGALVEVETEVGDTGMTTNGLKGADGTLTATGDMETCPGCKRTVDE